MTTDKRNSVPTLRAAAEAVVDAWEAQMLDERAEALRTTDKRMTVLAAALRTDRDLSARRTRRRRGTDVWAPVTPTPERGNRS